MVPPVAPSPPAPTVRFTRPTRKKSWFGFLGPAVLLVALLVGVLWLWTGEPIWETAMGVRDYARSAVVGVPLRLRTTRQQALDQLAQAFQAETQGDLKRALNLSVGLEWSLPAWRSVILLKQATWLQKQGEFGRLEELLHRATRWAPLGLPTGDPLRPALLWMKGQQAMRHKNVLLAHHAFKALHQQARGRIYGQMATFQLGMLSYKLKNSWADASAYWQEYLAYPVDGSMRQAISEVAVEQPLAQMSPIHQRQVVEAASLYEKTAQVILSEPIAAPYLVSPYGLYAAVQAKNSTKLKELWDGYLKRTLPGLSNETNFRAQLLDVLSMPALSARILSVDALADEAQIRHRLADVLWGIWSDQATHHEWLWLLLRHFPTEARASDAAWELMRPYLRAPGGEEKFLQQAESFLNLYSRAPAAAAVLFWSGHLREKTDPSRAREYYHRVLKEHPSSYYAFRAWARWSSLVDQTKPEPYFWQLPKWVRVNTTQDDLRLTSSMAAALAGEFKGWTAAINFDLSTLPPATSRQLVAWLADEMFTQRSPTLQSWRARQQDAWGESIRVLRDAFLDQAAILPPDMGELEALLLYPVRYPEAFANASDATRTLAIAIAKEESSWDPTARSGVGAQGMMQLMPQTAREVAASIGAPININDPQANARLGIAYLDSLMAQFQGDPLFVTAAYNSGPGAVKKSMASCQQILQQSTDLWVESCLYNETRFYVHKVYRTIWNLALRQGQLRDMSILELKDATPAITRPYLPQLVDVRRWGAPSASGRVLQ